MIIDASVAFKWLIDEDGSDIAVSWLVHESLKAPAILHAEVGNALTKRVRGNELVMAGAAEQLLRLATILTIVDERPFMGRALEMAVALDHSYYDCIYLAVSEAEKMPLLTADTRFVAKVEASQWATLLQPWAARTGTA